MSKNNEKSYGVHPPKRNKVLYIMINCLILFSAVGLIVFQGYNTIYLSLSLGVLFTFNGVWSINSKWYSFIHRKDKSYNNIYSWIIFTVLGISLLVLSLLYLIL